MWLKFSIAGVTTICVLLGGAGYFYYRALANPERCVRSQVSRVKSEMRSTANALEAYYVETNSYPPSTFVAEESYFPINDKGRSITTFRAHGNGYLGATLTTPIAHLGSYFPDGFPTSPNAKRVARGCSRKGPPTFGYYRDANGFVLFSPGPDRDVDLNWNDYESSIAQPTAKMLLAMYDPTNGTISSGDIIRVKY